MGENPQPRRLPLVGACLLGRILGGAVEDLPVYKRGEDCPDHR